jgi:predicted dehydrogenase
VHAGAEPEVRVLFIEIDGTEGAISWRQEEPNSMLLRKNGKPHQLYTRDPNAPHLNESGSAACRLPSGHPEAFFEAFANVYRSAYDAIVKRISGEKFETKNTIYPNVYDGVDGMHFIQQCVASSQENGAWLPMKHASARP